MDVQPPRELSKTGQVMTVLLVLMLVAFVSGHFASSGKVWNHITGETFSPWRNYVSDYAYRSPVWPIFVGCIYSMGAVLGALSWRLFVLRPGIPLVVWLMSALLGYSGLKLIEVAIFPVKPPEVSAEELQSRLDKSSWERLKKEVWSAWEGSQGRPVPDGDRAWEVVDAFGRNAGHLSGIRGAMLALAIAITLGTTLKVKNRLQWIAVSLAALSMVIAGTLGIGHGMSGLWQRIAFVGIYLWLWLGVMSFFSKDARHRSP